MNVTNKKEKGLFKKILHLEKAKRNNTFPFCNRISASKFHFILHEPFVGFNLGSVLFHKKLIFRSTRLKRYRKT